MKQLSKESTRCHSIHSWRSPYLLHDIKTLVNTLVEDFGEIVFKLFVWFFFSVGLTELAEVFVEIVWGCLLLVVCY